MELGIFGNETQNNINECGKICLEAGEFLAVELSEGTEFRHFSVAVLDDSGTSLCCQERAYVHCKSSESMWKCKRCSKAPYNCIHVQISKCMALQFHPEQETRPFTKAIDSEVLAFRTKPTKLNLKNHRIVRSGFCPLETRCPYGACGGVLVKDHTRTQRLLLCLDGWCRVNVTIKKCTSCQRQVSSTLMTISLYPTSS